MKGRRGERKTTTVISYCGVSVNVSVFVLTTELLFNKIYIPVRTQCPSVIIDPKYDEFKAKHDTFTGVGV